MSASVQEFHSSRSGINFAVKHSNDETVIVPVPSGEIESRMTSTRDLRMQWQQPPKTAMVVVRLDPDAITRMAQIVRCVALLHLCVLIE